MRARLLILPLLTAACATVPAAPPPAHDLVVANGTIYDGSGGAPFEGYVAVDGDRIVAVGSGKAPAARKLIDARGQAVAPGFINMLSWATEALIEDGRGLSDIRQGVTLEVMGEGESMGPLNPEMKRLYEQRQNLVRFPVQWTTLGEYLSFLERKGISPNVASFVGATTVRVHELGEGDVDPTPEQLERMKALVRQAMHEGAMGVGSSLIYAPASYAETPELKAIVGAAAQCGGMYISHMRSEGDRIIEAVDELIEISRDSGAPAEIYHLKMAGRSNWNKLDDVIARVEAARRRGLRITADMYTYVAGASGLDAAMPTWVQAGGLEKWIERMRDPAVRARVAAEMRAPGKGWENLYLAAGGAEGVFVNGFRNPALKQYTGKSLAEVARLRGTSPEDAAIDLVIEDGSRVETAYFMMDEANVRRQTALPWMSFGSDAPASADEGVFRNYHQHPRGYGNFARLLGKYVRDEKMLGLAEAIRKLTSLPATNLGIKDRGRLAAGMYADIVVFDPATIADRSTFAQPRHYAVGVRDVLVNGVAVLRGGEHTGEKPGRFVKGPGAGRCAP